MALLRSKMASLLNPTARSSLCLYLGLRILQFGATTLALAFFSSLIGWHNSHYCSKRFYHDECAQFQRDYAKVPIRYVIFVITFCFMMVAAFGLFRQHISSFLDSMTASNASNNLTGSIENDSTTGDSENDSSPSFKLCRQIFRSVPKSTLLIDSTALIVVSLCLYEYWTAVIRPFHVHTVNGWTVPVCWLFEYSGPTDAYYWKNLRVEKQRCMDNQISFYSTIGVVAFTASLVIVDYFYLRHDLSKKNAPKDDTSVEASDKQLLIDVTA